MSGFPGQGEATDAHFILDQLGASRLVVMLLTKLDKAPDVLQQSINLGISLLSGETVELQRSFYHHLAGCSKNHNFMQVNPQFQSFPLGTLQFVFSGPTSGGYCFMSSGAV